MVLNKIALFFVIIGAIVWGILGIFDFNIITWMFSGTFAVIGRIIYIIVGISGIWCISLLFRNEEEHHDVVEHYHTGTI